MLLNLVSPTVVPVKEALFALIAISLSVIVVPPPKVIIPFTFHIPAVKETLVILAATVLVRLTFEEESTTEEITSPIKPAGGAVLVLLPLSCNPVLSTAKLVVSIEGTPEALVDNTPLLAVARAAMTFADDAYNNVLTALVFGYVEVVALQLVPSARKIVPVPVAVAGYVAVEKLGAAAALDCRILPVVPGPAKIEGTPVLLVTNNPSLAVARAAITFELEA